MASGAGFGSKTKGEACASQSTWGSRDEDADSPSRGRNDGMAAAAQEGSQPDASAGTTLRCQSRVKRSPAALIKRAAVANDLPSAN